MSASLVFEPQTAAEAVAWLDARIEEAQPVSISGNTGGSASGKRILSAKKLTGTRFFDPDDLVVGVEAGMTFAELHRLLADHRMILPVNPWFVGETLGSMLAENRFGPNRMLGGGLRDHIIGIEYVDGEGRRVKAGGKVVKNVTGYDLSRMMIGSRGGLGFITAIHFKFVPAFIEPHGLYLSGDLPQILTGVARLNRLRLPLDWLQMIFKRGHWALGIGISGNGERRARLVRELRAIFGDQLVLAPDGCEPAAYATFSSESRFGGFLTPHLTGSDHDLHVHGVYPSRTLLNLDILTALADGDRLLIVHPIGADFHVFSGAAAETVDELVGLFRREEGYLTLIEAPPEVERRYGCVVPKPAEYALMVRLKQKLDPHGIFAAPFYEMM